MRLLSIIILFIFTSCFQNKSVKQVEQNTETLKSLTSQKHMVKIDSGSFTGFIGKDTARIIEVKSFYLDDSPITNAEFLEFVRKNPQWRRSNVKGLFADDGYLHTWQDDLEIPANVSPNSPVTNVSWFAAKAYAESVGKRLPTIEEWEFAAIADKTSKDASKKPEFTDYILESYQKKKDLVMRLNKMTLIIMDYIICMEWFGNGPRILTR